MMAQDRVALFLGRHGDEDVRCRGQGVANAGSRRTPIEYEGIKPFRSNSFSADSCARCTAYRPPLRSTNSGKSQRTVAKTETE
jgi:hypothetical protein